MCWMQFVFYHCSLLGVVEVLMGHVSGLRSLGTVSNPSCYFRHSRKVILNFDFMTTLILFKFAT